MIMKAAKEILYFAMNYYNNKSNIFRGINSDYIFLFLKGRKDWWI